MASIQDYLTEEIVWDDAYGGQDNNLAFRFTALNLKESTAKAAIYEKALAGVPWRFVNEARIDEGREPIPEMEGKLIMATPQGAVDISDVPTVRELLEMQQASKAAPPAAKALDLTAIAEALRSVLDYQRGSQPAVTIEKDAINVSVSPPSVNVAPPVVNAFGSAEVDRMDELAASVREATAQWAAVPPPVVNVAAPIVNVAAPEVTVHPPDTSPFTDALNGLTGALAQREAQPKPVIRREVRRDKDGRIKEVIDHRGE
jgi:ribosomal protein L11